MGLVKRGVIRLVFIKGKGSGGFVQNPPVTILREPFQGSGQPPIVQVRCIFEVFSQDGQAEFAKISAP